MLHSLIINRWVRDQFYEIEGFKIPAQMQYRFRS